MARGERISSRTQTPREDVLRAVAAHLIRTRGGPVIGRQTTFHLPQSTVRRISNLDLEEQIPTHQTFETDRITGRLASSRNSNAIPLKGGLFEPSNRNEEIMRRVRRK
jgi:hypothetical protein